MQSNKKTIEEYLIRGNVLSTQDKFDEAIAAYNTAIELDPTFAIAYNNSAFTYEAQGKPDKAMADYNKAIELDPKDENAYSGRGYLF